MFNSAWIYTFFVLKQLPNIQKYENVFDEYTCGRSKTCETANDCVDLWRSGTEQKKRKNQHNKEIQTKKPTKINHFKTNVFKCVLIVKKNQQRKSFFWNCFSTKICQTYDLFKFCLLKKHCKLKKTHCCRGSYEGGCSSGGGCCLLVLSVASTSVFSIDVWGMPGENRLFLAVIDPILQLGGGYRRVVEYAINKSFDYSGIYYTMQFN